MEQEGLCRMLQGNCIQVLSQTNDVFDGVLTSPPYNLGDNPRHRKKDAKDNEMYTTGEFQDSKMPQQYIDECVSLFKIFERVIIPKGVVLWNMGISTKNAILPFQMIQSIHEKTEWTIGDVVYWKKKTAMPFQTSPNKCSPYIEPIYVFCRKDHVIDFNSNKGLGAKNEKTEQQFYKMMSNTFEAPNGKSTPLNNATFSVEMATELLSRYFKPGQHVLDTFAGSGTTLRAAKGLKLKSTGIEIDHKQVEAFNEENVC